MVEIFFLHQLLSVRKKKVETNPLSFITLMLLSAAYRVLMHKNIAPVGAKHSLFCSVEI